MIAPVLPKAASLDGIYPEMMSTMADWLKPRDPRPYSMHLNDDPATGRLH